MAEPRASDEIKLKRVVRYLSQKPRGFYFFTFQADPEDLVCVVDSDWAGCTKTRKSTSGGAVLRGAHCLAAWSRTQSCISLSSGEAELNAILKGATETMGLRTLMEELGLKAQIKIKGDSSVCHGVLHREGHGRVKHLALKQLWLQSHVKSGDVVFQKIPRAENPADSLVKNWGQEGPEMLRRLGIQRWKRTWCYSVKVVHLEGSLGVKDRQFRC